MGLDRTPARDVIAGTVSAWLEVLARRGFEQLRDTPRFRVAFKTLAATRRAWPVPADFLEALPRVIETKAPSQRALIGNDAVCRRGLQHTREIFGDMRLTYDGEKS